MSADNSPFMCLLPNVLFGVKAGIKCPLHRCFGGSDGANWCSPVYDCREMDIAEAEDQLAEAEIAQEALMSKVDRHTAKIYKT